MYGTNRGIILRCHWNIYMPCGSRFSKNFNYYMSRYMITCSPSLLGCLMIVAALRSALAFIFFFFFFLFFLFSFSLESVCQRWCPPAVLSTVAVN